MNGSRLTEARAGWQLLADEIDGDDNGLNEFDKTVRLIWNGMHWMEFGWIGTVLREGSLGGVRSFA
jgi:hypothetical protein